MSFSWPWRHEQKVDPAPSLAAQRRASADLQLARAGRERVTEVTGTLLRQGHQNHFAERIHSAYMQGEK